jgi:predicted nucleotidyltransferase
MGIRMPKMGMPRAKAKGAPALRSRGLADALFSKTRQRVLGLLFGQPDRAFGTIELIKLAESGSGAVQRELATLTESGLIQIDDRKRYRANRDSPVFDELKGIVEKTSGVAQTLRAALAPIADKLRLAVLFGSVAKHTDTASSDIDLLVVSDELALEDLFVTLEDAEGRLGRRVNPTLYTVDEFRNRRGTDHPFLSKVMNGKHVVLLGSEDVVTATR